jgi:hypothetical protein
VAAFALVAFVMASVSAVDAKTLLRERFERLRPGVAADNTVRGKDGSRSGFARPERTFWIDNVAGSHTDFPVSFDNAASGAVSFDLQRRTGPLAAERQTLFELIDGKGAQILFLQVQWASAFDPARPAIIVNGPDYYRNGVGLWSPVILLDHGVQPGQWMHVDLAWDDGAGRYALYVDGRLQNPEPKFYDLKRHVEIPDPRTRTVGGRAPARGRGIKGFTSSPFAAFTSRAAALRVGINSHPMKPGHGAASPLSAATLDNLRVFAGEWPAGLARDPSARPGILSVSDDTFKVPGIGGKLVAGETVTVRLVALPGGTATFDMGRARGVAMAEQAIDSGGPGRPPVIAGTYVGRYTIVPGDDFANGQVVGRFVSADNVAAEPVLSASRWTIETKPVVTFAIEKKDLPADQGTKSRIRLTARDANGNPLKGRNLKLTLSTTDEYTGTVGAGDFGRQVGASVETRWKGATDAWGEVEFDYVAGFAAKTVILQAKDLDSGGVSVDYLTAYKEASIDIALTAPRSLAAARRGLQYAIKVEASRTQLTADGRSRSVIRATVTDPNGKPVPGDAVTFALSSPNGTLRTIVGVTDVSGTATAEYVAGRKIGVVVISATDTVRNVSGSVSILLLADAPAKVILKANPATLPADGNSRADIHVRVTDINDNPNRDTRVEFKVVQANMGRLDHADRVTDKLGDATDRFTAGTTPGIATILATVRSKVPTEAELLKAKNVLFVPGNEADETVRIEKWLKKKGDKAAFGEPIVTYSVGRDRTIRTIVAPYDLTMGETFVEYWDNAEVGQTLATVVPTPL